MVVSLQQQHHLLLDLLQALRILRALEAPPEPLLPHVLHGRGQAVRPRVLVLILLPLLRLPVRLLLVANHEVQTVGIFVLSVFVGSEVVLFATDEDLGDVGEFEQRRSVARFGRVCYAGQVEQTGL